MRIVFLLLVFAAVACNSPETNAKSETVTTSENNVTVELEVEGMTCIGCEGTIQTNVASLEGVTTVKASHTEGKAIVEVDARQVDTTAIKAKIAESGYAVVSVSLSE
jgi:copper chaperone CopZ